MSAETIMRTLRRRAGLSLRALAERAGTSHSTLAAYEAGRVVPNFDTIERVAAAAGLRLEIGLVARVAPEPERALELADVLEVADQFPVGRSRELEAPVFGRA